MSRGARRLRASIAALGVLMLAGCADARRSSSGTPVAPRPSVEARTFVAAHAPIDHTVSGECFTASITVDDPRAYRCLAGSALADPCFVTDRPDSVVCFADPWTPGIRLTLAVALPAITGAPIATRPWALELANGARCVVLTGTVVRTGGAVLVYGCGQGAGATSPGRENTVRYGRSGAPLRAVMVRVTWAA